MGYSLQFFFITIEEACFPGNYNTTPCDLSNTVMEITSTTIKEFSRTQSSLNHEMSLIQWHAMCSNKVKNVTKLNTMSMVSCNNYQLTEFKPPPLM